MTADRHERADQAATEAVIAALANHNTVDEAFRPKAAAEVVTALRDLRSTRGLAPLRRMDDPRTQTATINAYPNLHKLTLFVGGRRPLGDALAAAAAEYVAAYGRPRKD